MKSALHFTHAGFLRRRLTVIVATGTATTALVLGGLIWTSPASAQPSPVGLGSSGSFAVLANTTVTNTGSSVISGNLGLSPGTSVSGFPPGTVTNGSEYIADGTAAQAQTDLTTAYNDAAGRTPTATVAGDLGGQTLVAGVYNSASSLGLTGTLILDGQNNSNSVFIFQAGSTLTTATNSTVSLINGAQACNVFWQVGSSATIGTSSNFTGTVLALTSATLDTSATVAGRILARNGAVTLDSNTVTVPTCIAQSTPTTSATTTTTSAATTTTSATTTTTSPTVISGSNGLAGPSGGSGIIPTGAPQTGAGGASHSGNNTVLFAVGSLALAGAVGAVIQGVRRRRLLIGRNGLGDTSKN